MADLHIQSEIYLDVKQKNIQKTIIAKQYDAKSRYILAHIIDDGEPIDVSGYTLDFKVYTQDDRAIFDDCVTAQSEVGDVIIELSESLLYSAGKHMAELVMISNSERLATMTFTLVVEASVYSDDRIIATDEFSALAHALGKVDDAVEIIDRIETEEAGWIEAETERVYNEGLRTTNENVRVNNENTRISNENARVNNENTRISNENARITAETARASAETIRISNEADRVSAETTRVSNENTRIANENDRVAAESSRVTAENGRISAETEREANTVEAIGKIDEGLANVEGAVEAATTAAEGATAAKEAAEEETAIQIANNTRAEELIGQMEDIVDENQYLTKAMLGVPTDEYVVGIATLDENAKLDPLQFPYGLATSEEVEDFIDDYFENIPD